MELLVVLVPLVAALVLCAWHGVPRVVPLAFAGAATLVAGVVLVRALTDGVGWPWPLAVGLDVPLPGSELQASRWTASAWISLGAWSPSPGLLLDPLALILVAVGGAVFLLTLAQGYLWRASSAVLVRGLLVQACLAGAVLTGDLLLAVGCLLGASASALWQADPSERPTLGPWVVGATLCLLGACGVASAAGGSTWAVLAASVATPAPALLLLLGGLAGLRSLRWGTPADPVRAGVAAACRDGAAPLLLVAVLARLAPALAGAPQARTTWLWGALVVAVLCGGAALRAADPLGAARGLATATLALIVVAFAAGAPASGVLLAVVAAPALAGLHLALAGLVREPSSERRAQPSASPGRRPLAMLGALLAVAVLCGLPPWGVHRAWASTASGLLAAGDLAPLLGLGAACALFAWALGRVAWDALAPGLTDSALVPKGAARRAAPLLCLGVLASLLAAWVVPGVEAWRPDALAARLLAQTPGAQPEGWLVTPLGVSATPAVLIAALVPTLIGLGLAGWGPSLSRVPRVERPAATGPLWNLLGKAAASLDSRIAGVGSALGARAQRAWERPDPLPARSEVTPGRFGYLGLAYRDAALASVFVLGAILVGVLLG